MVKKLACALLRLLSSHIAVELTDAGAFAISEFAPHRKSLKIESPTTFTNLAVRALRSLCSLERLDLSFSSTLGLSSADYFAQFPLLKARFCRAVARGYSEEEDRSRRERCG